MMINEIPDYDESILIDDYDATCCGKGCSGSSYRACHKHKLIYCVVCDGPCPKCEGDIINRETENAQIP